MKGVHICKRIFFFSILCLLWLPNYCDINQNDVNSPDVQTHQTLPNDPSRTENVPTKQKEETSLDVPQTVENVAIQPNVEYVNNLENEEVERSKKSSLGYKSSNEDRPSETNQEIVLNELESSRISTETLKDSSLKDEKQPVASEKENTEFTNIPTEPVPVTLVLTAPTIEPSVAKASVESSTVKLMETSPKSVSDSIELSVPESQMKVTRRVAENVEASKHSVEDNLQQPQYDGMPSFDEWKKMMLAEQEKGGQKVPSPSPPGKKISSQKRRRNYSSYECGAKVVASNAEAEGTSRILNEKVDEYMLNPCKAKIWFVLELCESVQATQIELANFELFSSCPRDFAVYSSDNFPTRDWVLLGTFTAVEQRVLQSFELKQEGFGKFIKIELLSYYGKEHYCPLSVVRIFGTSMVDEYEEMEMEKSASHLIIPDDDLDRLDIPLEDSKPTNIFGSATDAVLNIVKKAAQALGQHQPSDEIPNNETVPDSQNVSASKLCKAKDNSAEKCKDIVAPIKSEKSDDQEDLSASPSSTQRSLFRLLHRCDQCVPSRIRYYSSAQPHCRFFQAVFGPLVLQRLCDWFREHPLVFAHDSSARHKKVPSLNDLSAIPLPTKSPPPQIMVVPLENDLSIKTLFLKGNLTALNRSIVINATKTFSSADVSRFPAEEQLETSVPAHSGEIEQSVAFNETESGKIVPSVTEVSAIVDEKSTDTLSSGTSDKAVDRQPVEASSTELPVVTDVFLDADEEQMKEFITVSEDLSLPEIVTSTEMPASLKTVEGRSDFQGRIEPVSVSTAGQKESVFMRMSNRIKSLELNMSLSSQYLQELSQRYRRQMEEMQRAFNRTIGTLNDTARKAAEKDIRQQEILNSLQLQVGNLTGTVETLLSERSSIFRRMIETHICLMVIEAIVMITLMSLYVRRITASINAAPPKERETAVVSPRLSKRRSSVDSCSPPVARKVKKRSASEEGLNAGDELLIVEPLPVLLDPILKAKKKNRKRSKVQRSISQPTVQRRNSSPSWQQCGTNPTSHSEGCVMKSVRSKHNLHSRNHSSCENCINNVCSRTQIARTQNAEKERRLQNGTPFQNLTNGSLPGCQESPTKSQKKEKFSFRKFLKFQKRDSI